MYKHKMAAAKTALKSAIVASAGTLLAAGAWADQQILDDLIVDGSACIGFDCVNGESFGFDTLRLKENNLRIKAFDTSSSASFPTQDWQLTFNDTSNGGQNKFAVECVSPGSSTPFTVEGCAPSHSLYVDDGGRIGFGTSTPVTDLHVKSGNTPTLRLEQDGSSGFSAQTWDVAGNEANFFIRDATNGSKLPIRLRPGAPTSTIDIAGSGNVGIGDSTPDADLDVEGDLFVNAEAANVDAFRVESQDEEKLFRVLEATSGEGLISIFNATGQENIRFTGQQDGRLAIGCNSAILHDIVLNDAGSGACNTGTESTINAGATAFTITSSRTQKENIKPVRADGILSKVANIGVYNYDYIDGPEDRLGLMAEDFHQVFERGSDKTISGQDVQIALWLAVQELTAKVGELESQLAVAEQAEQQGQTAVLPDEGL